MNETAEEAYRPEEAFLSAVGDNMLGGEPLRKFSTSRKEAADRMGWVHPSIVSERREKFRRTGLYPGILADMRVVLWVCSLRDRGEFTPEDYKAGLFHPDNVGFRLDAALDASRTWAEEKQFHEQIATNFAEAYEAYVKIVFEIEHSLFKATVKDNGSPPMEGHDSPKTLPGPPASRKASHAPRGSAGKRSHSSGKK